MGIGAQSPIWRRMLLRGFSSTYIRRRISFMGKRFEAYLSPGSSLKALKVTGLGVDLPHQRFITNWIAADSIVWDIGMNVGMFALPAAIKACEGHVYGFEADVELAVNLLRTRRLPANSKLPFSVFCAAVSDADGTAHFEISRYSRAMNKLEGVGEWHREQVQTHELRSVVTIRIDTLVNFLPPPTAIKIDVEGAEVKVLKGGEKTIAMHRPVVLIEGPKELWNEIGSFFVKHDYIMLDGGVENPVPLSMPVWDTIAVPREKYDARRGAGS